jgi:hypothetical protein
MRRFLSKLAAVVDNSNRGQGPRRRNRSVLPRLEALEERQVLSTLFLTPGGNDATHFSTFRAAYNAARAGDVIQVEPGADVSDHGAFGDPGTTLPIEIGKQITLQADPAITGWRAPVRGWVEVLPGTTGVVFNNLDFNSPVVLQPGSQRTTVENSTLHLGLYEDPGTGNSGNNVITHNTVMDRVDLSGDPAVQTADQVTSNQFVGHGSLCLTHDNGFWTDARFASGGVIQVDASANVTICHNGIHFNTPGAGSTGLSIFATDKSGTSSGLISDNTFDTGGVGTGLAIWKETPGNDVSLKVQDNNFNANAVGVLLVGDGTSAGTIDLGGGPLGSHGRNDFSTYTVGDGRFAIVLEGTTASYTVHALGNYWHTDSPGFAIDPHRVIKDRSHQQSQSDPVAVTPLSIFSRFHDRNTMGTGVIDVETFASVVPGSGGVGSGSGPSYPLGVWPSSWNTPGSAAAASHPPVQRMM